MILSKPCDGIWSHDSTMLYHFGIVRPNAFGFAKIVFAVPGGNFARKKILQNQKFLKYVQECPVKCLWLKSKIAKLSDPPIFSKDLCGRTSQFQMDNGDDIYILLRLYSSQYQDQSWGTLSNLQLAP